jgi:hypothetical protein
VATGGEHVDLGWNVRLLRHEPVFQHEGRYTSVVEPFGHLILCVHAMHQGAPTRSKDNGRACGFRRVRQERDQRCLGNIS